MPFYPGEDKRVDSWEGKRVRPTAAGGWWSDINPAAQVKPTPTSYPTPNPTPTPNPNPNPNPNPKPNPSPNPTPHQAGTTAPLVVVAHQLG